MKFLKKLDCKKLILFLLVFIFSVSVKSHAQQFASQLWHQGYVITVKKDTVRGLVKYDMEANSIQVKTKQKVFSFSSHSILISEIFDETVGNNRKFYSIPYELNSGFKTRMLFELLLEGPVSLLAREEIVQETATTNNFGGPQLVRDRLRYNFFFLDNKGEIQFYNGRRSELIDFMSKKGGLVKSFIKENKLKTDEVRDLIRIVAFYNSI